MKPNWLPVFRHWDFPQISEEQESWRTWRRKIVQTQHRSNHSAQKVGRCCSAALESSGPNWTVKPLVFLISHWRFILLALVFVKFFWRKAVAIAVAFRCCGLYIGRAVKNKTTNGGYRLVWESLNCWMSVKLRVIVRENRARGSRSADFFLTHTLESPFQSNKIAAIRSPENRIVSYFDHPLSFRLVWLKNHAIEC